MALASRPRLVLLDEPMAGMGPEESARMEQLIGEMRQRSTVVLIEHDVDAVFRLADRVSVLVGGRIIASGKPDVVRRDPEVMRRLPGRWRRDTSLPCLSSTRPASIAHSLAKVLFVPREACAAAAMSAT